MNRECGITTVDEVSLNFFSFYAQYRLTSEQSEIPERWRAAALSKIESSSLEKVLYFVQTNVRVCADRYHRGIHYQAVITETPTFVSLMI
jgi:hypothetical protein